MKGRTRTQPRRHAGRQRSGAMEGVVRDLAHGGEAIVATDDGLIVFAPLGVIGERVRVEDVRPSGKVFRAVGLEVLTKSPERVEPACANVARCGGCPFMMASLPLQHAVKRRWVADAIEGLCGTGDVTVAFEHTSPSLGYRTRARLAWARTRDGVHLGYLGGRSHELVDIETCPVLDARLEHALVEARAMLVPKLEGRGELWLNRGADDKAAVVVRSPSFQSPETYEACERLAHSAGVAGVAAVFGGASPTSFGDAHPRLEAYDGTELIGTLVGFSQAHATLNRRLVERAVELAGVPGARVLELYAGHGNFTVCLAATATSVLAIEQDPDAAAACVSNLRRRNLENVRVISGDVARVLPTKGDFDVVLLDPPRRGAAEAVAAIVNLKPARIVYVSCDPKTLRRDLEGLHAGGYRVTAAVGFDMFPQTAHVECVVALARISTKR